MILRKIFKTKKGVMEDLIKKLLWITLFVLLLVAVYFIIKTLTS